MALPNGGYSNQATWPILYDHDMLAIASVPDIAGGDWEFYINRLPYTTFFMSDVTISEGKLFFRTYLDNGAPSSRFITIGW